MKIAVRTSVLLVEDDESVSRYLEVLFRRNGFQTSRCTNGREGFLKLMTGNHHVVMLDLLMPGIDGFDVLRTVREMYFPFMRRIIVLSGASEALYREPIYENEIFARLDKTADPGHLIRLARRCALENGAAIPRKYKRHKSLLGGVLVDSPRTATVRTPAPARSGSSKQTELTRAGRRPARAKTPH